MNFGERPTESDETKSPAEIMNNLNQLSAEKLQRMQFLLVKDYGLDSQVKIKIGLRAGAKIATVEFDFKGLRVTFAITKNSINEVSRFSLNDSEIGTVGVMEDEQIAEQKAALRDYFFDHPEDRPL